MIPAARCSSKFHDILWLQITMDHLLSMKVVDSAKDLLHDSSCSLFVQVPPLHNLIKQFLAIDELQHQVDVLEVLEGLQQAADTGMVQMPQYRNFSLHNMLCLQVRLLDAFHRPCNRSCSFQRRLPHCAESTSPKFLSNIEVVMIFKVFAFRVL